MELWEIGCPSVVSAGIRHEHSTHKHMQAKPSYIWSKTFRRNFLFKYILLKKKSLQVRQWWHTPLIPTLDSQRQVDFCDFEVSLIYKVSFSTLRSTQWDPVTETKGEEESLQITVLSFLSAFCLSWHSNWTEGAAVFTISTDFSVYSLFSHWRVHPFILCVGDSATLYCEIK